MMLSKRFISLRGSAFLLVLALAFGSSFALAQINQGTIVVTAQDSSGAMIPGANLELVELSSNSARKAVTSDKGTYTFVNLNTGTYRLSVSRTGYQTKIYDSVLVDSSSTTTLVADLPVGAVTETVRVTAETTPVLQTSSTEIGTVINTTDIENLPLSGRSIASLTQLTAGFNGTWNGLPESAQGTNVDGAVANNSRTKYQGLISTMISPRIESFEQVSVVTDGLNLGNGFGQATTQLNYVSRRGSNRFHGRAYYDFRNSGLNANSWASNASGLRRAKLIQHDFGVSVGGPILHDKLFFFGTYAEFKQPGTAAATNFIFSNPATQGNFTYTYTPPGSTQSKTNTVNVLQLAHNYNPANSGTVNPDVNTLIQNAITAVNGQGLSSLADPTILGVAFNAPATMTNYYPVARLDYNATDKVRMYLSWIMNQSSPVGSQPPPFPGSAYANQNGNNFTRNFNLNYGLDYIISPRVVNSFKFGFLYNIQKFVGGATPNWLTSPIVFYNMTGDTANNKMSGLNFSLPTGYEYPVFSLTDSVAYQKGAHNFNFGFQGYREQDHYYNAPAGQAAITFGIASGDPVVNAFGINNGSNNGALPAGTPTAAQSEAEQLYAVLTGRISTVNGTNGFDQSTGNYGPHTFNLDEVALATGVWFQDSWKVTPTLTFNYGLRWDFTVDPHDIKAAYHNALLPSILGPTAPGDLFKPGTLGGINNPAFVLNPRPFHGWYKTPQPQVALNWNPKPKEDGFLKKILGDGETVIRAGFGLRNFTEPYQFYWDAVSSQQALYFQNFALTANTTGAQGTYSPGTFNYVANQWGAPGVTPLPYSLSPPVFPQTAPLSSFTFIGGGNQPVDGINPNIRLPYAESWSLGVQRALSRASVLEIRYNGNRTVHQWININYNEVNIFENGFLQDFQNAQKNLAANGGKSFSDAGRTKTPIIDAAFANTASNFTSTQFINYLINGQAGTFANQLAGNGQSTPAYFCALVGSSFGPCKTNANFTGAGAGYPVNFFQANPYVPGQGTKYMTDAGYSNYNALQVDLRQASWHGLQGDANYTFGKTLGFATSNNDYLATTDNFYTLRNLHLSYQPGTFDIRHVFNAYGTYDLPFGKGKAFLSNGTLLNEIVGGVTIGTALTYQSGAPFLLTGGYNTYTNYDGGVSLPGTSVSSLQKAVGVNHVAHQTTSLMLNPKFYSSSTGGTANYSLVGPNTTAGTIGNIVWLHGPNQYLQNASISKVIPIKEQYALSLQGEFINVWNHPAWKSPTSPQSVQSTSFATAGVLTGTTGLLTSTGARQIELRANFTF